MNKKNIIKNIIITILVFVLVNLCLNYKVFLNFLYRDSEISYEGKPYKVGDNIYQFTDINKDIKALQIIFDGNPYYITVSYTSDDFKYFEHLNRSFEQNYIENGQTLILVDAGKIKDLQIYTENPCLNRIIINPHINYYPSFRLTTIYSLIVLALIFILKDNSLIDSSPKQKYYSLILMIILFALTYSLTKDYVSSDQDYLYGYHYTDALMKGHLTIDYPIEDNLRLSPNPYDTSSRNFTHLWDASYYNGNYYSYFGIWPAFILLIPYKLITGNYMTNNMATLIFGFLCVVITYLLYKEIIKKYLKETPYNLFILSYLFILFGSKLIWSMHRPSFYEYIAMSGYFHVLLGLYLVLFNENKNRIRDFFGYLSLALTALCRPTYLVMSLLIVPKLFKRFKNKDYEIKDIIIFVIPYLVIGLLTMYLNYRRFGSILEFGIKYQLTVSNLINVSFSPLRSLFGAFNYMFETINVRLLPFEVKGITNPLSFITDYYIEPVGGGFMITSILGIFMPFLLKAIEDKELKLHTYILLIIGVGLLLLAGGIGSLIGRYMLDFNYIFYFIITIEFLYIIKNSKNIYINRFYMVAISASIILNYLLALSNLY